MELSNFSFIFCQEEMLRDKVNHWRQEWLAWAGDEVDPLDNNE